MKGPRLTFAVFVLGSLVVLGALGWVTSHALRLERAERAARQQAKFQESIRLVLWRMDSAITPIIAREAARPYFHYQSFFPAGRAYASMLDKAAPGDVLIPSPLLRAEEPFVHLHYQHEATGPITSPQVPDGPLRDAANPAYIASYGVANSEQQLVRLQHLLTAPVDRGDSSSPRLSGAPAGPANPAPVQTVEAAPQVEVEQSANEYMARQSQVANVNRALQRPDVGRQQFKSEGEKDTSPGTVAPSAPTARAPATPELLKELDDKGFDRSYRQRMKSTIDGRLSALDADRLTFAPEEPVEVSDFRPRWVPAGDGREPELVFERTVRLGDREIVQGFWLDWPALHASLVDSGRELLAGIELHPLTTGVSNLAPEVLGRTLAAVPAELVVSSITLPAAPAWTPLRTTLLVTWVLAAGSILAIGAVLRAASELAERRGRFVSAVTHELRTPLTTFVLYSQMLADGVVREQTARDEYIATLKSESQRLARIVESVLDYARLGKRRPSTVRTARTAQQVVADLEPVLSARCSQSGMQLVVERSGDLEFPVTTDPATLERIVFNLVDNACKYAADAADRRVHLAAQVSGRDLVLSVRDHGPGVDLTERRSVFRPFTRGRRQADGSTPGLGLGLALARGLAREIGGELRLIPSTAGGGAEFTLRLPRL